MIAYKKWVNAELDKLWNRVCQFVIKHVDDRLRFKEHQEAEKAREKEEAAKLAEAAAAAEEAIKLTKRWLRGESEPHTCGCRSCHKNRSLASSGINLWKSASHPCIEDRLADAERKLAALLDHLGLESEFVPKAELPAHFKIAQKEIDLHEVLVHKGRRAGLTTRAKQARRRSKG